MRDKILARLKEKFPGVNLSKKRLDAIADKLTPKIKEESEIDAKLDDLNDVLPFADMAKEDDKIRTLEAKLKEKDKPKPKAEEEEDSDDDPEIETPPAKEKPKKKKSDETPAWAKAMMQEIATLKADKMKGSLQAQRKEKLKDVDEEFYDMIPLPEKEEDLDDHVEQIKTRWTKFNDGKTEGKLINGKKPVSGAPPSSDGKEKEASKDELDKVMPNIM